MPEIFRRWDEQIRLQLVCVYVLSCANVWTYAYMSYNIQVNYCVLFVQLFAILLLQRVHPTL